MIRVDYPPAGQGPLHLIRHRLQGATRRTRLVLQERRRELRAETVLADAAGQRAARLADLDREQERYDALFARYDDLVGVLCAAAHEGIEPHMETEYRALRTWLCAHYPQSKRALSPFLQTDASDGVTGRFGRRACDAVEALFFPQTIAAMLASDNGNLIGRLLRTQEAFLAWQRGLTRRRHAAAAAPAQD